MEIRIVKNVLQANAEIASQIRTRLNEQRFNAQPYEFTRLR